MSINLYPNPDEPVVAKRTCPPVPCGGDLSAFGGSRFVGEPKIFATKALRHKGFYFVILSSWLGTLVAEWNKFCQKNTKFNFKHLYFIEILKILDLGILGADRKDFDPAILCRSEIKAPII